MSQKRWYEWDLNQWLYILENRHIQEVQLGLSRIAEVAQQLNLKTTNCKVITVAGTNGKGSTVAALEMIYHTAGYKVGSYTSPHLLYFNERIKVNLNLISDEALCHCFSVIEDARGETPLTYFEMTTLAALWHFKQQHLDLMILEVGLGGRLDATNIVDPDLSIITTIDLDHQEFLGTNLEAIGYEKAGILRPEKPFIYADAKPPNSIMEVAKTLLTPIFLYGTDYTVQEQDDSWHLTLLDHSIDRLPKPQIQLKSAAAALSACLLLQEDLPVADEFIYEAMPRIFIPGRLQLLLGEISILYDVSHNPQSARLLADTIRKLNVRNQIHAVFSVLKDKDIFGLIFPLKDCVDYWYPAQLDYKRAASTDLLMSHFKDAEIFVEICYNNPLVAFNTALSQAKPGDLVIVYGSFFTVSQVMASQH